MNPTLRFQAAGNEVFPDWRAASLSDLATVVTGSGNREDSSSQGDYIFFDRSTDDRYTSEYAFDCEAIIVAGEGKDFVPRYYNGKFGLHQRVYAVHAFKEADGKYLYYYMGHNRDHFLKTSVGTTMPSLRMNSFHSFPIALPSLPEQRRIADALSAVDAKIDLLDRKRDALARFKAGLMQKLFSQEVRFMREDGSAYPDWEEKALSQIAMIIGGGTPSSHTPSYWGGNIPWFTPTEIKRKYLVSSIRTISDEGLNASSAKMLPAGALLLSTRATVGDVGIAMMPCCTNQGFQSLVVNEGESREFWYYWLIQHRDELLKRASGSTFLEISKKSLGGIPAMRPSEEEQERIACALAAIDAKLEAVSAQISTIQAFKRGLLQQMFV